MTVQRWTRGGVRSNRFIASPVDTVGGIKFKQRLLNIKFGKFVDAKNIFEK
jgi:hypothetical protein